MRTNRAMTAMTAMWATGLMFGLGGVVMLGGCSKPPPPPPPPPPPKHTAPPPPEQVDTEALLQQLQADARVQFPNAVAPTSQELAHAVVALADAFARGDAAKLRPMLDATGAAVLDELQGSGAWDDSTHRIEAVRITGMEAGDDAMPTGDITMAVQEPAAAYQLRWHATPSGNAYIFSPMESDSRIMARAGDFDGSSAAPPPPAPTGAPDESPAPPNATKPGGGGGTVEAGG